MKVVIIDDDILVSRLVKQNLGTGYQTLLASSAKEGMKLLSEKPDLVIIDLDLEERLLGLSLIEPFKKTGAKTVVVSNHDEESVIEKCYEAGCDIFYSKGVLADSIHQIINDILLKDQPVLSETVFTDKYVTVDTNLKNDIKRAFKGLMQSSNVLISGETGTGKSEVAKLFHEEAKLKGEFVAINCASIPKELLESELFGHTKGSFTGAVNAKTGKLKLADNGILFLDEINSMSLDMQAKLLKAVEEKKFYPVGAERMVESSFRLIAASNENLFELVAQGRFRLDLLQRLCGTMLELSPIRERTSDVAPIMKFFNKTQKKIFLDAKVKEMVSQYDWKGNTREVKRFTEYCLNLNGGKVTETDFKTFINLNKAETTPVTRDLSFWIKESLEKGLDAVTDEFRKNIISEVMKSNANVTTVMKDLQISTRQFYKHVGNKKNKENALVQELGSQEYENQLQ